MTVPWETTSPVAATLGIELHGADLRQPLDDDGVAALRELLREHRLLLFRDQAIEAEDQMRLMAGFGRVINEDRSGALFTWVTNQATKHDAYIGGSAAILWHSDLIFMATGPLEAISLYALEAEEVQPTGFANMVWAAEHLPPDLRQQVEALRVFQLLNLSATHSSERRSRWSERLPDAPSSQYPHSEQPFITTHPVTGEPYLTMCDEQSSHVVGWDDERSDALFAQLQAVAYTDDVVYWHQWRPGDLIVWDNIALQHARPRGADRGARVLRRVAVNPKDLQELLAEAGTVADSSLGGLQFDEATA